MFPWQRLFIFQIVIWYFQNRNAIYFIYNVVNFLRVLLQIHFKSHSKNHHSSISKNFFITFLSQKCQYLGNIYHDITFYFHKGRNEKYV